MRATKRTASKLMEILFCQMAQCLHHKVSSDLDGDTDPSLHHVSLRNTPIKHRKCDDGKK